MAIFRSLGGENLEDFSIRLAQAWRIGRKGLDNGVVFLIFVEDRRMRLEVGYGLEPTLTDAIASSIIRDVVAPRFREGRLADGIGAGLDAIAEAIAGTYQRPAASRPAVSPVVLGGLALILLTAIPLLGLAMIQARARRHGWTGARHGWTVVPAPTSWGGSGSSWSSSGSSSSDGFSGGGGSFGGGGASGSW